MAEMPTLDDVKTKMRVTIDLSNPDKAVGQFEEENKDKITFIRRASVWKVDATDIELPESEEQREQAHKAADAVVKAVSQIRPKIGKATAQEVLDELSRLTQEHMKADVAVHGINKDRMAIARPKVLAAREIAEILAEPVAPPEGAAAGALKDALALFANRAARPGEGYRCLKAFSQYQAYQLAHDRAMDWEDSQKRDRVLAEVTDEVTRAYEAAAFREEAQRWEEARPAWEKAYQLLPESDNRTAVHTKLLQNVIDHMAYVSSKIKPRQAW